MRRDRKGTAISKESKQHRVTFRDEEIPEEAVPVTNTALFTSNDLSRAKSVPIDLTANQIRK